MLWCRPECAEVLLRMVCKRPNSQEALFGDIVVLQHQESASKVNSGACRVEEWHLQVLLPLAQMFRY